MVGATLPECIREVFEEVMGLGGLVKIFFEGRQVIHQSLFRLRGEDKEALLSRVAAASVYSVRPIYPVHSVHSVHPVHSIHPVQSIPITLDGTEWRFKNDSRIASAESYALCVSTFILTDSIGVFYYQSL